MAAAVPLAGKSSHHNFQASTRPAPAAIARRSQPRDYLNQASSEIGISRPQRLAAIDAPTLDSAKRPRAALALPPIRPAPDVRVPWAPTAASASASRPRPRTRCVTLASRRTDAVMSVAYEPRSFIHEGAYPPMGDDDDEHGHRGHDGDDAVTGEQPFSSTEAADHLGHYTAEASILADEREMLADDGTILSDDETATAAVAAAAATAVTTGTTRAAAAAQESDGLDLDPGSHCFSSPIHSPLDAPAVTECGALESKDPSPGLDSPPTLSRNKQILKPDRDVAKHSDGKYHCPISDCKEDVRTFSRKCEWNKHMDKHERPYRCPAEGCENLPGFTYSGGLLRHEREVHGKHGGPKNTVNCPYPNCKRHTGKGFSRQENLNEHLRRVHTNLEGSTPPPAGAASPEEHESDKSGSKRKRRASDDGGDEIAELRDEVRRVREENAKLKAELEQHSQHSLAMMAQIAELQDALRHGLGAPTARML